MRRTMSVNGKILIFKLHAAQGMVNACTKQVFYSLVRQWNSSMRLLLSIGIAAIQALLVAFAGQVPDMIAPVITAMVYLPLWPLATGGIPVFVQAQSWGWSSPSFLGWLLLAAFWTCIWWLVVATFAKARK